MYVNVLYVNVHTGFCIATVGKDRYGLGGETFDEYFDVYMFQLFFGPSTLLKTILSWSLYPIS